MDKAQLVLSVETATLGGSVAITRGEKLLGSIIGDKQNSHSNTLLSDINEVLGRARVSLDQIELFAAASGPGSFTGLRIGIATVKGLAVTLRRPSIGVPTLRAVAHAAGASKATVALLPAGRGEVFAQLFSVSETGAVTALDEAAHLPPQRLVDRYKSLEKILWAGEGAHVRRETIEVAAQQVGIPFRDTSKQEETGWVLAPRENNLARSVAALALLSFEGGESGSPEALQAIYVRPSDAELKLKCQ